MTTPKLSALVATAAVAIAAFAPAAGQAKATSTGKHTINVKSTYVYKQAGKIFDGTMFKGETVKVERLSPSGKWAYVMAYGHVNRHVWVEAGKLNRKK